MVGSLIKSLGRLSRFDTSVIAFLSLFLPLLYATGDISTSVLNSLPVLAISMCGFVINDLHDIDKDIINHPDRPLPSKNLSPFVGSVAYFFLLTASLALIRAFVAPDHVYLYLLLLIGLINYNYVVQYIPAGKNLYVAAVGILPIVILASLLPTKRPYASVVISLFLYLFSREMLMDIEDAAGDGVTLVKWIGLKNSRYIAFGIKATATVALLSRAADPWGLSIIATIGAVDLLSFFVWERPAFRASILFSMKLQLLLGLYFLL